MFAAVPRWKPLLAATPTVLILFALCGSTALAQESFGGSARQSALPGAPRSQATSSSEASSGTITGTVLDTNGAVLPGARLTLMGQSSSSPQIVESGGNGQFAFSGLQPDIYTITVSAPGMKTFTSSQISLQAGGAYLVPPITLLVSGGATTVTVNGNKEQLSKQQVRVAEQQRVVGMIPNFYSAYDWNAPPMLAKQKFQLGLRSFLDPFSLLSVAGVAGAEQYKNVFPAYGGGFEGYGKRYGAALANHASSTLLERAVLPAIFHQDPRYFYKGKGSFKSRAFYAISAAVIARGDNGRWQPNYSSVLGNFSAAAVSNLYYPASDRGASLVLFNGLAGMGADAASNLLREFLLKPITSHAPQSGNGQP